MATTVRLQQQTPEGQPPLVEIAAEDFAEFVETHGRWISTDGAFLPTDLELKSGLEVDCVCRMADGFELFRARCMVAWRRHQPDQLKRPAGIALHFLKLDDAGRQFVEKLVENHQLAGGEPFDVDRERPRREQDSGPDERRLHRMMEQGPNRTSQVENLRSSRSGPVHGLTTGQSFAPGLEASEAKSSEDGGSRDGCDGSGSDASPDATRAPVPRQVLETLGGASASRGSRGKSETDADTVDAPVSQILDSGQIEPQVLARARAGPQPDREDREPGEAGSLRADPVTRGGAESPPPSSKAAPTAPTARDAVDRSRSPSPPAAASSEGQRKAIHFTEAPRRDPLRRSGDAASTPAAERGGEPAHRAADSPAASAQAAQAVRQEVAHGPLQPDQGPESEQLHVDADLFGSGETLVVERTRRRLGAWLWLLLVLAVAALIGWAVADPDLGWSLRGLLQRDASSSEATAQAVSASGADQASVEGAGTTERIATRLQEVAGEEIDGITVIWLDFDGALDRSRVSELRLPTGRARHVVKITGIEQAPTASARELATSGVERLRFGLHRIDGSSQLHVVLDLATDESRLAGWQVLGDRLILRVR